jgi:hypothetical protein
LPVAEKSIRALRPAPQAPDIAGFSNAVSLDRPPPIGLPDRG